MEVNGLTAAGWPDCRLQPVNINLQNLTEQWKLSRKQAGGPEREWSAGGVSPAAAHTDTQGALCPTF